MPPFDSQSIENSQYSNIVLKSLNSKIMARNDSFYAAKNINYYRQQGRYSSKPNRPTTAIRRESMQKIAVKQQSQANKNIGSACVYLESMRANSRANQYGDIGSSKKQSMSSKQLMSVASTFGGSNGIKVSRQYKK